MAAQVGNPPVVFLEEEEYSEDMSIALFNCREKGAWTPHYARLPFVIYIGMAGDLAQFYTWNLLQGGRHYSRQFCLQDAEQRARQ